MKNNVNFILGEAVVLITEANKPKLEVCVA
jgi:hypothetical protein